MAALTITATSVVPGSNVNKTLVQFGEAVTQGQLVYQKSTDGKYYKCQADGTAEESGSGVNLGVALSNCAASQWGGIQTQGTITIGATCVVGTTYYAHTTAGSIGEYGDLSTGHYITVVGRATTTGIIKLELAADGTTKA